MCEGETIPLSDSDEEADSDSESLDGVSREADMFLLNEALSQYGIRSDVVRITAGMMKVKKGTLCFFDILSWVYQVMNFRLLTKILQATQATSQATSQVTPQSVSHSQTFFKSSDS